MTEGIGTRYATPEGTAAFRDRFVGAHQNGKGLHASHFRESAGLMFSSIGFGSYLGESDEETDRLYAGALRHALGSGVNVIDSAINYRCQRSERVIGEVLSESFRAGTLNRGEIILCTKGGYLPFDGQYPDSPWEYFQQTYFDTGLLEESDVVQNCHALRPSFLEDQLARSLKNLRVETIDIYYLHNPETQLEAHDPRSFREVMRKAFEWLEEKVAEGKIRLYGVATWNGFRVPKGKQGHLSLEDLNLLAREIAGTGHHFQALQLPVNLAMPEAWILSNQTYGAQTVPFLPLARRFEKTVIGSASLLQGRLAAGIPEAIERQFKRLDKTSQCSLQFCRSLPGMTTALVGMKQDVHVEENLGTARVPQLSEEELLLMFQKSD